MDQAVHAPDYPRDLKADWLVGLRAEIIEPIRARAVAHPFIADLCWTVITPRRGGESGRPHAALRTRNQDQAA